MQFFSDDSQDPHTESRPASRDIPPLLAINVPGQGPVVGTYAQYTIVRPLITLEVENGICYMSTQFELEVEVLGNSSRPSSHQHFFKHVKLHYNRRGEMPSFYPQRSPQNSFTVSTEKSLGLGATVDVQGPPPSAGAHFTLTWNKTVRVEEKVPSWTVGASHKQNYIRWKWTANIVNLANPSHDIKGNVSWMITVRRSKPAGVGLEDFLDQAFVFQVKMKVQQRRRGFAGHFPLGRFNRRPFITESFNFQIPAQQHVSNVSSIARRYLPRDHTSTLRHIFGTIDQHLQGLPGNVPQNAPGNLIQVDNTLAV